MAPEHLPVRLKAAEREHALAELRGMDETLTAMTAWLAEHGENEAAGLLDDAWQRLTSAGWVILRNGGLVPRRVSPNGLARQF